ncbi:MAG: secondary thiamine-phosphate synthase enzyme YjbQ [Methanobacteriota archaeon]
MVVYHEEFHLRTKGEVDIIDITEKVQQVVVKSKIKDGLVCVFVPGSTGAVTMMEYEPGLQKDVPRMLERVAPKDIRYDHHETWHDDNGHSHVRASLLGPSLTIPVQGGRLVHGTWQQLVFIELDTRSRERTVVVQLVGE